MFLVEHLKAWGMFLDPLILKADYNSISSFCWVPKKDNKQVIQAVSFFPLMWVDEDVLMKKP